MAIAGCFALVRFAVRRRATKQEAAAGCLACGSMQLSTEEELRTCLECGYTGCADGGGVLTAQELYVMHERPDSRERW
jgi:hypothetical protein